MGNQFSVSVWVTVTPEKYIQPSGDEELLKSESVYERFLFSAFLFKSKEVLILKKRNKGTNVILFYWTNCLH